MITRLLAIKVLPENQSHLQTMFPNNETETRFALNPLSWVVLSLSSRGKVKDAIVLSEREMFVAYPDRMKTHESIVILKKW